MRWRLPLNSGLHLQQTDTKMARTDYHNNSVVQASWHDMREIPILEHLCSGLRQGFHKSIVVPLCSMKDLKFVEEVIYFGPSSMFWCHS